MESNARAGIELWLQASEIVVQEAEIALQALRMRQTEIYEQLVLEFEQVVIDHHGDV